MTIAYWCVLAIIVLPFALVASARFPGLTLEKNLTPRNVSGTYEGSKQRIYWAHLNSVEVIAPFAAAVIIAHNLHLEQGVLDNLALSFVGFRIAHAVAYMANLGVLRTLMFAGGFSCVIALFVFAA